MTTLTGALEGLLSTLPTGHVEKPGVIRAIEISRLREYRDEPGANRGAQPGAQEPVPGAALEVSAQEYLRRFGAIREALAAHSARAAIVVSPGAPGYGEGLTARCICSWRGTSQVEAGNDTVTQRGLAEEEAEVHLVEKILERLG